MAPLNKSRHQMKKPSVIFHLLGGFALLALLTGCGGPPKPSEDDLKNALAAAIAHEPFEVSEVDFIRRDITGDSAAITFEVEFRHTFDLYDRESLSAALQALGKSTDGLNVAEAWSQIRPQPIYQRVREKAGVPADAAPTTFPTHVLRRVVKAGETHRTKGQIRANWDGFKWVWTDDQIEQKPSKKGGKKRGDHAEEIPVISSEAELLALHEKAERDLATFLKLAAAAETIETETLAAFADTLRPGLVVGGEAAVRLPSGQTVPETWTLEIESVDTRQRRFTALLRGDAPWQMARSFYADWSYRITDPGVLMTLQSPRASAVKNGGPVLSSASDMTLGLVAAEAGWTLSTDKLKATLAPFDAEAVAARRKAVRAEADTLLAQLTPGTTWQAIRRNRDGTEEYELRVESTDTSTGLVRMSLATAGKPEHRREFTGTIEANRYVHEGWPLRIDSDAEQRLQDRKVGGSAAARSLGEWVRFGSPTAFFRVADSAVAMKSDKAGDTWTLAPITASQAPSSLIAGDAPALSGAADSAAIPADWDGLTPVLEIDGTREDAFAAAIKINQSPMDILRGSATIQLTETRPLPVLPASSWRVLMGGESVRETGLDGPSLSRFDAKKILRLEKTTAGFAAVPAAARLPLRTTPAGPGAWFAPRQPLPPGTYALLIDTTCFAFEVR